MDESNDGTTEMESLRRHSETLHLDDVDGVSRADIASILSTAVNDASQRVDVDLAVTSIYVLGSYATGDALPLVSDLDVRYVVEELPEIEDASKIETLLKNDIGFQHLPDEFGFLDARLDESHPHEYPSIRIS